MLSACALTYLVVWILGILLRAMGLEQSQLAKEPMKNIDSSAYTQPSNVFILTQDISRSGLVKSATSIVSTRT
jgi:hypothetical protein